MSRVVVLCLFFIAAAIVVTSVLGNCVTVCCQTTVEVNNNNCYESSGKGKKNSNIFYLKENLKPDAPPSDKREEKVEELRRSKSSKNLQEVTSPEDSSSSEPLLSNKESGQLPGTQSLNGVQDPVISSTTQTPEVNVKNKGQTKNDSPGTHVLSGTSSSSEHHSSEKEIEKDGKTSALVDGQEGSKVKPDAISEDEDVSSKDKLTETGETNKVTKIEQNNEENNEIQQSETTTTIVSDTTKSDAAGVDITLAAQGIFMHFFVMLLFVLSTCYLFIY